jgi:hypothetical protein
MNPRTGVDKRRRLKGRVRGTQVAQINYAPSPPSAGVGVVECRCRFVSRRKDSTTRPMFRRYRESPLRIEATSGRMSWTVPKALSRLGADSGPSGALIPFEVGQRCDVGQDSVGKRGTFSVATESCPTCRNRAPHPAESGGVGGAGNRKGHAPLRKKESMCRNRDYRCVEYVKF